MKYSYPIIVFLLVCSFGCKEEVLPKPKAKLRLTYPKADYVKQVDSCAYTFDQNQFATIKSKNDCSMVLDYDLMKGSIYLTYRPVDNNLNKLLTDAQKLSYEHAVKADNIVEQPFINAEGKVYGMFYEVTGNAASQSQFYVTDSINHFVTGSLYFYSKPNYDSILPAAVYLQNDIRRIMESLEWKK